MVVFEASVQIAAVAADTGAAVGSLDGGAAAEEIVAAVDAAVDGGVVLEAIKRHAPANAALPLAAVTVKAVQLPAATEFTVVRSPEATVTSPSHPQQELDGDVGKEEMEKRLTPSLGPR